jgi:PleD family two-component response regulator
MKSEPRIGKMQIASERDKNSGNLTSQPQRSKILLVDSEPDRQARIAILKQHGFRVYPALAIEQARSRCRSGAYDLIILNADSSQNVAFELCDEIQARDPKQHVLVMTAKELSENSSKYAVSSMPERLLERVESLLSALNKGRETLIA